MVSDKVVVIDSTTEIKFVPGYRNERRRPVEIPQLVLTILIGTSLIIRKDYSVIVSYGVGLSDKRYQNAKTGKKILRDQTFSLI